MAIVTAADWSTGGALVGNASSQFVSTLAAGSNSFGACTNTGGAITSNKPVAPLMSVEGITVQVLPADGGPVSVTDIDELRRVVLSSMLELTIDSKVYELGTLSQLNSTILTSGLHPAVANIELGSAGGGPKNRTCAIEPIYFDNSSTVILRIRLLNNPTAVAAVVNGYECYIVLTGSKVVD